MHRFFLCIFVLLVLVACSNKNSNQFETPENERHSQRKVEIFRDKYGTPHIYADSNYGVYYGYGYAVATDRLFQMEMLKRTVKGNVSEVLGKEFLSLDKMIRTSYDHRSVRQQLDALSVEEKEILDAYAQGFNKRINEVLQNKKQYLPKEFNEYDFLPIKWNAYDAAMIFVGAIAHRYSDFNSELDNLKLLNQLTKQHGSQKAWNIFNASKWLIDPDSPTTVPREYDKKNRSVQAKQQKPNYIMKLGNEFLTTKRIVLNKQGKFFGVTDETEAQSLLYKNIATKGFVSPEFAPASNFWAVNKNLKDAKGVLVNGPQFGWSLPSYVYGVGLHGGDFNVVGNTLLGLPALLFAHNNYVSWGSTAGLSDQVDVYIEQLNKDNAEQYLHKGKYREFESWDEVIRVRNEKDITVKARRSVHGMIVQMDAENNRAYSRARAWEGGELNTLMAWINLPKKRTLDSVQASLAQVTTNINFYYMDVKGNLGYTHGGRYPARVKLHDPRLPVPGTGELDWQGYRPYVENPNIRNPEQGYIMNWNNRPAANWISIDLWSYTWSRTDRSWSITNELEKKENLSVDDVWKVNDAVSYDDVSGSFLLPYLKDSFNNIKMTKPIEEALNILSSWNQEWRVDQDGNYGAASVIIENWLRQLFIDVIKDDVGQESFMLYSATQNPNNALGASMYTSIGVKVLTRNLDKITRSKNPDYDFFNGKDHKAVLRDTFTKAINSTIEKQGNNISKWKLAAAPMQWKPFNFRGVPQASKNNIVKLPAYMNRGSENNLFIVDGKKFTAYDVIPPGQSGQVNQDGTTSDNYTNQLQLFADYQYKAIPFTKEQVKKLSITSKVISY